MVLCVTVFITQSFTEKTQSFTEVFYLSKKVYDKLHRGLFEIPPDGRNDPRTALEREKGQTRRQQVFTKRKQQSPPCLPLLFFHVAQSFRMERSGMRNLMISNVSTQKMVEPINLYTDEQIFIMYANGRLNDACRSTGEGGFINRNQNNG